MTPPRAGADVGNADSPRGRGRPRAEAVGGASARERIVSAAEREFADRGYDATSLRQIARRAGVDPSLIHHYFSDKAALFAESLRFPANPGEILAEALDGPLDGVGERAVRAVLTAWDAPKTSRRGLVLLRTAGASSPVGRMLRTFIEAEILGRLAGTVPGEQAALRASLTASQIVGLIYVRYGLRLPPLAEASQDDVVAAVGPTIQRYLTGDIGIVRPEPSTGSPGTSA